MTKQSQVAQSILCIKNQIGGGGVGGGLPCPPLTKITKKYIIIKEKNPTLMIRYMNPRTIMVIINHIPVKIVLW